MDFIRVQAPLYEVLEVPLLQFLLLLLQLSVQSGLASDLAAWALAWAWAWTRAWIRAWTRASLSSLKHHLPPIFKRSRLSRLRTSLVMESRQRKSNKTAGTVSVRGALTRLMIGASLTLRFTYFAN